MPLPHHVCDPDSSTCIRRACRSLSSVVYPDGFPALAECSISKRNHDGTTTIKTALSQLQHALSTLISPIKALHRPIERDHSSNSQRARPVPPRVAGVASTGGGLPAPPVSTALPAPSSRPVTGLADSSPSLRQLCVRARAVLRRIRAHAASPPFAARSPEPGPGPARTTEASPSGDAPSRVRQRCTPHNLIQETRQICGAVPLHRALGSEAICRRGSGRPERQTRPGVRDIAGSRMGVWLCA